MLLHLFTHQVGVLAYYQLIVIYSEVIISDCFKVSRNERQSSMVELWNGGNGVMGLNLDNSSLKD